MQQHSQLTVLNSKSSRALRIAVSIVNLANVATCRTSPTSTPQRLFSRTGSFRLCHRPMRAELITQGMINRTGLGRRLSALSTSSCSIPETRVYDELSSGELHDRGTIWGVNLQSLSSTCEPILPNKGTPPTRCGSSKHSKWDGAKLLCRNSDAG